MQCEDKFDDATYGKGSFCKSCGMDLGINPVIIKKKGTKELFCCEECVK